jgi:hypothetical protein
MKINAYFLPRAPRKTRASQQIPLALGFIVTFSRKSCASSFSRRRSRIPLSFYARRSPKFYAYASQDRKLDCKAK